MLPARPKYLMAVVGALVFVCLGDGLFAQQNPRQQRPNPGGSGAGRQIGRRPGEGRGGMPGMGNVELLRQDAVRKELELLDDQVKELEKLGEEIREMMRDVVTRLRENREQGQPGNPQDMRQIFQPVQEKAQARMAEILLPHQLKRLNQLSLQARLRGGGFAMLGPDIAEQLGITEQQREKLRDKTQEVEQDMRKKIAELRRQAQEELLSLLTPEQQAKYRDLVGAPFEFPPPQRPPGQPGGRERRPGGPGR